MECVWPARAMLGEGPVYDPRCDSVLFVDIKGRRLHRLGLQDGARASWDSPDLMCWIAPKVGQGYVAGLGLSIGQLDLDPFRFEPRVAAPASSAAYRLNDAKVDARGVLWAGTMDNDEQQSEGVLFRLDGDWSVQVADTGYGVANGPTFCPRGEFVYHTDSARRVVYRFRREEHRLVEKTPFVVFEPEWGYPDGMTTDAEGGIWIAHWDGGRVSRFTPEGELERSIALPVSRVTSCCFAGQGLDRMFVTTAAIGRPDEELAGALFEIEPGARGLPPTVFGAG